MIWFLAFTAYLAVGLFLIGMFGADEGDDTLLLFAWPFILIIALGTYLGRRAR